MTLGRMAWEHPDPAGFMRSASLYRGLPPAEREEGIEAVLLAVADEDQQDRRPIKSMSLAIEGMTAEEAWRHRQFGRPGRGGFSGRASD